MEHDKDKASVSIMLEKEHKCEMIKKCPTVFIQTLNDRKGWFIHIVENSNTLKERVVCCEALFCPWCGADLTKR